MADPPDWRSFVAGEIETQGYLDAGVRTPGRFLRQKPICTVYTSGAVAYFSGVAAALSFDLTLLDLFNMHNPASNPMRITPTYSGWYEAAFTGGWAGNATGYRQAKILKNSAGSPYGEVDVPSVGANGMYLSVRSVPFYCNGGTDYATVELWQNSGGNLNIGANSYFCMEWKSA